MFFSMDLKNKDEPVLEPLLRQIRFGVAKSLLENILIKDSLVLDYGCGPEGKFYKYLKKNKIPFKKYIGYDPLSKDEIMSKDVLITADFKKIMNLKYDLITMFAVLEHLDYPYFDFSFLNKIMKRNGYLILTTPTKSAKFILEFLSYKLGMVSEREIEEHKHYFSVSEIASLFKKYGFKVLYKKIFELGMNNYVLLSYEK